MNNTINVAGSHMPSVGLGLWKIPLEDTAQAVVDAIEIGYRHLDSAADYANEQAVGQGVTTALQNGLCTRDELWITSKLWNTFHRKEHVRLACEKTLKDLNVEYLDLYLIHFPISLKYVPVDERYPPEWLYNPESKNPTMEIDPVPLFETWRAMEELVESGLVKHIGVCNYNSALLHDLNAYATIKPAMLQVESHPYLCQEKLFRTAADLGMAATAFSPLGALSYLSLDMATEGDSVLKSEVVLDAAQRLGRSAAQVVLRWGVQRGMAIIPKTSRIERLRENLALFDFELNDDEMAGISSLNKNQRFNDPGVFCELAFGKFNAIYD